MVIKFTVLGDYLNILQRNYHLSMNSVWASHRAKIAVVILLAVLLSSLVIGLLTAILGSFLLALLVFVGLVCWLLRTVGLSVMYPGACFYTRSEIELQFSRDLSARMVKCFNALHAAKASIVEDVNEDYDNRANFEMAVGRHIRGTIRMLAMFEDRLSLRKQQLLRFYRQLGEMVDRKEERKFSISELMNRPKRIPAIREEDRQYYANKFVEIIQTVSAAAAVLNSFAPPDGMVARLKYRIFAESLYEIRFGYCSWDGQVSYQLFSVPTADGEQIETAIVSNLEGYGNDSGRKTVLFCNPNGVYIQFFANHEYIANYLKLGYRVILWNYRGYGQSTGSPSLRTVADDAYAVYRFYRMRELEISVVHGYSIGGVAAVGLLRKIAKNASKNPSDQVEALVIDRSFSSIAEIAKILGPVLSKVGKALFFIDDIDVSRIYEGIQCRKLLIWDSIDEIIPNLASVKEGLLMRRKIGRQGKESRKERDELNEQINVPLPDLTPLVAKFEQTVRMMLLRRRRTQVADKTNFNSEEQRETSMSTASGLEDSNFQPVIQALNTVDGGGVLLFRESDKLQLVLENNPQIFRHLCESYLLGLVCYGSCFPLRPILHDRQAIKSHTSKKLQVLLKLLGEVDVSKENLELMYSCSDDGAQQIRKNFYYIYSKMRQVFEGSFGEEGLKRFGSLLPTSNGHNNSLIQAEMRVLNAFLTAGQAVLAEEQQS